MPKIVEKNKETGECLVFDFPSNWKVVKYDQEEDSSIDEEAGFYRRIILGEESADDDAQGIRAMDIVCRLPGKPKRLQLIEVKDDRKRKIAKGDRETELYKTLLLKTVGTLAGLTLAERLGDDSLRPMACMTQKPAIEVILFLIEPPEEPVPIVGSKRTLRRLVHQQLKTTLDQRLSAALNRWGLLFTLYNLSNRLPPDWQVREIR
ncbi:hypothetical protein IC235_19960 [Hymenobacter sp. BT664]|uniref:Uncharacterized protein n=1 Tax=Hymenobacter montanus TaxID=2771359 RepID=A0A927GL13_9BACT|nr:hypothetical protein [Hymenobacter montanus]MBD2770168.1 hypothetical protein [Hymenobacter montanus]